MVSGSQATVRTCHDYSGSNVLKMGATLYLTVHYTDVIMGAMASQLTSPKIVSQAFTEAQIKENIKAPRHWPSGGEFTGGRWIPRTNSQ